jgi:hypothetical protein
MKTLPLALPRSGVRHKAEPKTRRGSVLRAGSCHQSIPISHDRLRSSIAPRKAVRLPDFRARGCPARARCLTRSLTRRHHAFIRRVASRRPRHSAFIGRVASRLKSPRRKALRVRVPPRCVRLSWTGLPSSSRSTNPVRISGSARRASSRRGVMWTVRRVRPFGVPITYQRICWFAVIGPPAMRSTSSCQRSALTSTRSTPSLATAPKEGPIRRAFSAWPFPAATRARPCWSSPPSFVAVGSLRAP